MDRNTTHRWILYLRCIFSFVLSVSLLPLLSLAAEPPFKTTAVVAATTITALSIAYLFRSLDISTHFLPCPKRAEATLIAQKTGTNEQAQGPSIKYRTHILEA